MRIPIQVLVYPVRKANDNWEYLMLKRVKSLGGFWQGVTGALRGKENLVQAANRLFFKETGYIPNVLIQTDLSFKIPMKDGWNENCPVGTKEIPEYLFIAKIDLKSLPKIDLNQHTEWKWCSFEEAMDLLYWENNKVALEYVKRFLDKDRE